MNKAFRVVWNQARGAWQVAPEVTRARGGPGSAAVTGALALALVLPAAQAAPTGAQVAAGQVGIQTQGAQTSIVQGTDRAIVNWQSFGIGAGEAVRIQQPGAQSVLLNRVVGAGPSVIDGQLLANGQVFIVNPQGVVFGRGAQVDVGGLVASTLSIRDDDFMAGRYRFERDGVAGAVTNLGELRAAAGGLIALIGSQVDNRGLIAAREGSVLLGAGSAATLTFGSGPTAHTLVMERAALDALVHAGGAIRADGGQVVLAARALDAALRQVVNQDGVIEARGLAQRDGRIVLDAGDSGIASVAGGLDVSGGERGGQVSVTGQTVHLQAGSRIDARGATAGGTVSVGGGWQGSDASIRHAQVVAMAAGATIDVSATDRGDGGQAVLWSDKQTQFSGAISARGGAQGGNAGRIETSGPRLAFEGRVDLSAARGRAGELLLDPDIVIIENAVSSANDGQLPNATTAAGDAQGSTSRIARGAIEAVASGTVTIQANGYIQVDDLATSGGNGRLELAPDVSLVLHATNLGTYSNNNWTRLPGESQYGGIVFANAANTIVARGTGSITLQAGLQTPRGTTTGTTNGILKNVPNLQTASGNVTLYGADGIALNGNVTTAGGHVTMDGDADQGGVGYLLIAHNIATGGGNAILKGGNSSGSGVNVTGNISVGAGTLTFDATDAGGGSYANTYRIGGSVNASGNFSIAQPLTLGNGASISTTGQLSFGAPVTVEPNANLALTAQSYSIAQPINGNGGSITLAPANASDSLRLGTSGSGTNLSPLLGQLSNFSDITVGRPDLTGTITLSGTTGASSGSLRVLAGGSGGGIVVNNGASLSAGGSGANLELRAGGDITVGQGAALSAPNGKLVVASGQGNVSTGVGTRLSSGQRMEIAAGGSFDNADGAATFGSSRWLVYLSDPSKRGATGLTGDFKRYGCAFEQACQGAGVTVPGTGSGMLFAQVPVLQVGISGPGSLVYGSSLTGALSAIVDPTGLVDGDTLGSIGRSGAGGIQAPAHGVTPAGFAPVGTYAMQATAGNLASALGYRFVADPAAFNLAVTPRTIVQGGITALSRVYDGTTGATASFNGVQAATATTGILSGDAVSVTMGPASFSDRHAGTNKTVTAGLTLAGADAQNYVLGSALATALADITPRVIATPTLAVTSRMYDGTTVAQATAGGFAAGDVLAGDAVTASVSSASFANRHAGTNKAVTGQVALGGADAGNYQLASTTATGTGTITPRMIAGAALSAADRVYDGTTAAQATASLASGAALAGDAVAATVSGAAFADRNVGTGKPVTAQVALAGADAGNYQLAATTAQTVAAITPRTIVQGGIRATSRVYDGTTAAQAATNAPQAAAGTGVVAGDAVGIVVTSAAFGDKNVGSAKPVSAVLALAGADADNYRLDSTAAVGQADITPRMIAAVAVSAADRVYDGTTAAQATASLAPGAILTGDLVDAEVSQAQFGDRNVGQDKPVQAWLRLGGADARNYALSQPQAAARASITPRPLNYTIGSSTGSIRNGETTSLDGLSATLADALAGDSLAVDGLVLRDADGRIPAPQAFGRFGVHAGSLLGLDAANYRLAGAPLQAVSVVRANPPAVWPALSPIQANAPAYANDRPIDTRAHAVHAAPRAEEASWTDEASRTAGAPRTARAPLMAEAPRTTEASLAAEAPRTTQAPRTAQAPLERPTQRTRIADTWVDIVDGGIRMPQGAASVATTSIGR